MGLPDDATTVDLSTFWQVYNAIQQENIRLPMYTAAAEFWGSYHDKLSNSAAQLTQKIADMKANANWNDSDNPNSASTAFYQRMGAGVESITNQVAGAQRIQQQWTALTSQLTKTFNDADNSKRWLLQQYKFTGGTSNLIFPGAQPITTSDTGQVKVTPDVAAAIKGMTSSSAAGGLELAASFNGLTTALNGMPNPQWAGPHSPIAAAGAAVGGARGTGAGGGAMKAGGAGAGGGAAGGGKSAGGAGAAGGSAAGASGSTPSTGTGSDAMPDSADPTDSASAPGDSTDLAGGPDASNLPPPITDPTLAGSPTSTLPPSISSAANGLGTNIPTPLGSGIGSNPPSTSSSFAPFTFPSLANRASAPLASSPPDSLAPNQGSSTGGAVEESEPTLAAGSPSAGATEGTAGGYYPPMMPMRPGSGGQGSGIQSGEADGAGGPAIRWAGRDSRRAGLVPELQGRGSDQGAEPADDPVRYPPSGPVLDEELWQVSDFAPPVTPPEIQSHRSRSRGF